MLLSHTAMCNRAQRRHKASRRNICSDRPSHELRALMLWLGASMVKRAASWSMCFRNCSLSCGDAPGTYARHASSTGARRSCNPRQIRHRSLQQSLRTPPKRSTDPTLATHLRGRAPATHAAKSPSRAGTAMAAHKPERHCICIPVADPPRPTHNAFTFLGLRVSERMSTFCPPHNFTCGPALPYLHSGESPNVPRRALRLNAATSCSTSPYKTRWAAGARARAQTSTS